MTATLTKWYEEHGRHEIFAGGKKVNLENKDHSLVLKDEIVTLEEQRDLDKLGIAKNSREEKIRARDAKQKSDPAYNARMAQLYREVVLKEKTPTSEGGFIALDALVKPANGNGNGNGHNGNGAPASKPEIAEPVAGD
jgi:7,8-dihydro-6-hydroxymethylpterin dimethyltransferase